jgi:hypothetical protein
MKKLTLALDELKVQSFGTTPELGNARGTVHGASGCRYTDGDCSAFWSTCDADGGSAFCPVTGMMSCGCSNEPETCAAPCKVSDMTDCHRC